MNIFFSFNVSTFCPLEVRWVTCDHLPPVCPRVLFRVQGRRACIWFDADVHVCPVRVSHADAIAPLLQGGLDGVYTPVACIHGRPSYLRQQSPSGGRCWYCSSAPSPHNLLCLPQCMLLEHQHVICDPTSQPACRSVKHLFWADSLDSQVVPALCNSCSATRALQPMLCNPCSATRSYPRSATHAFRTFCLPSWCCCMVIVLCNGGTSSTKVYSSGSKV